MLAGYGPQSDFYGWTNQRFYVGWTSWFLWILEGTAVSVENFDGTGLSDQPGIVYGFTDTADTDGLPDYARSLLSSTTVDHSADVEIRELSRSGRGQPGPSRGDVVERDRTKSTLETRLPELDLPGQDGKKYDNCGDNIPAFACLNHPDNPESEGCGKPVYIGRSCASRPARVIGRLRSNEKCSDTLGG